MQLNTTSQLSIRVTQVTKHNISHVSTTCYNIFKDHKGGNQELERRQLYTHNLVVLKANYGDIIQQNH